MKKLNNPIVHPMTNGDRIRAMSDEELTELLWDAYNAGSDDAEAWHFGDGHRYSFEWDLEWLQQPAKEETRTPLNTSETNCPVVSCCVSFPRKHPSCPRPL